MNKIFICACVIAFAGSLYFSYDYGYTTAKDETTTYFLKEVQKLKDTADKESIRVSELEKQLAESSKKYEVLRLELTKVNKENEKWKNDHAVAKQNALSVETVERINEVLSR